MRQDKEIILKEIKEAFEALDKKQALAKKDLYVEIDGLKKLREKDWNLPIQ